MDEDPHSFIMRLVTRDIFERIISATDSKTPIKKIVFSEIQTRLAAVLSIFIVEKARTQKVARSSLDRQITALRNNIEAIQLRLNSDDHQYMREALVAAGLHFNLNRPATSEPHLNAWQVINVTNQALADLKILVDHLIRCQKDFKHFSQPTQNDWLFKPKSNKERAAHQALYPYLLEQEEADVEASTIRAIGVLYTWLFETPLAVSSSNKGKDRYGGPAIRFACAVITELEISSAFPKTQSALINKIGDLWTNDKRSSGRKSRARN